ncbi:sensor histidine kinase [Rhodococcus sp. SRB_17]|nr:sensor histidine kinase [Rhodococcus sp. SRB_17]
MAGTSTRRDFRMPHFDLSALARHGLVTTVLCCLIALVLALGGQGAWDVQLAYALSIGLTSWLVIDLGRLWLSRHAAIPWPAGWRGGALVLAGIATGMAVGTALGNAYSGRPLGGLDLWQRHGGAGALLITVAASVGMSVFFYQRGKSQHLQAQIVQVQRDAAEARLKLLEAQLEPHMVFNTLANLRALIATDPVRAQDMLDHLIDYLRATLSASRVPLHPLAEEFERLRDYLELMAVRMGARLAYALELPDDLRAVPVPPLLLQPLVENAIRHGLEPQVQGGRITVRASVVAGAPPRLRLQVQDSGAGLGPLPALPEAPGRHFGLAQVRERLATLHGADATLELIAESADGTNATITFPLKT